MGADISRIADMQRATRATEKYRGSWLDLTAPLRGFPLVKRFFKKQLTRTADRIKWRIAVDANPATQMDISDFYVDAYSQIQVSKGENLKELDMKLCKVRQAMSISRDEIELNGANGTGEQLVDIYAEKLCHELDQPLLTKLELILGGSWSATSPTKQQCCGLRYWLPAQLAAGGIASTTALTMNGGSNPYTQVGAAVGSEITAGAANMPVATAPRTAHAVCGFSKVSDDDLFGKLWEFRQRTNTFVPEGASGINSNGTNRQILCQTPVLKDWVNLQVIANDNPKRDLGQYRDKAMFMSSDVECLPVIDTIGSPLRPTTFGLLYDLDLDSFDFQVHAGWNFKLEKDMKESTPDVEVLYRQAYLQLACKDREKNLAAYTDVSSMYSLS